MKEREIVAFDLQRHGYTQRLIPLGRLIATTSTWPSGSFPVHGKNTYYERKRRKMGRINTMKTNSKRRKD
jgi:hypothetical protein